MKIGIQSPRGNRWDTSRVPDVVVLLVVEVVSPSTATEDYRAKHAEYAVLNIPEYWIVDPIQARITVCTLRDGAYDDRVFQGDEEIVSPTFTHLPLTVAQVLQAED